MLAHAPEVAAPPDLQVFLGDGESVVRLCEDVETARLVGALGCDEDAVRLLRPTADPSSKLVQLSEPEDVRVEHDHDGRVRYVDADLDDGRRDEDLDEP